MRLRRAVLGKAATAGELVMPAELVDPAGRSGVGSAEWDAQRRAWFRDHGIDPADWSAVYPVLVRSGTAHGFPLSLERCRLRAEGKGGKP